jgi:hypothetical protein
MFANSGAGAEGRTFSIFCNLSPAICRVSLL